MARKRKQGLSRRDFLKVAVLGVLAGCTTGTQLEPPEVENPTVVPATEVVSPGGEEATPRPTRTPKPTVTPLPSVETRIPDVVQFYPVKPSTVIHTHHEGVWSGKDLVPNALRQMVDASITQLTGLNDAKSAWQALFAPGERIAIKVNAFRNSLIWTHLPLVKVVTDSLQEAGIPAENVFVFDYYTNEMQDAGYEINTDGTGDFWGGVRCFGTDKEYSKGFEIVGSQIELSNILLSCNALINMPVLKSHMLAGMTFALKNHYGTLSRPDRFHYGDKINMGLPELNALPEIKDRTRLVIGDALTACLKYGNSWPYWEEDYTGDAILMSFDPVAHDMVGYNILTAAMEEAGVNTASTKSMAMPWFENATKIGIGTHNAAYMNIIEQTL